jgi:UDP-N-acetylglucosamine/UDP-N-acetylgalactosamine diphosphorylase
MDRPDHIFMSPDGHGGTLSALALRGMIDDMQKRGLKTIFYFQVDNALVEIADPAFIGMHRAKNADMSIKVCAKSGPEEKVGIVVVGNGKNMVVEYTELTDEQMNERLDNGELKYKFGSVAIHIFEVEFLDRESRAKLPLHIAHKKIPYCDEDGGIVKPEEPNAYKFEKFIFDAVPDAECVLNMEFRREDEFSPLKNATGVDSAETARRDIMLKFARWLEMCNVDVPRNDDGSLVYKIEIDPCYALGPDDLREKLGEDFKIESDLLLK